MKHSSRFSFALLIPISILILTSSLIAQRTGNPGAGTNPGTTNPGAGAPSTTTRPQQQPNITQPPNQTETQMPIFLSGKVSMDDGSPPPTSISIQRVCTNNPHTVAYTDAKGRFSFQWGNSGGIIPDASENTPMIGGSNRTMNDSLAGMSQSRGGFSTTTSMMGCELIANAPGFRSAAIDLGSHRAMDNPDLGTIVLHRLANVEGTSVSATSLNAPKDAKKAWEKGVQLLHKSKPADASVELEKAVALYPKYANAWVDLGRARILQKQLDPAREAFLKAIDLDGKLVEPYV
jgi:hypothetical protein